MLSTDWAKRDPIDPNPIIPIVLPFNSLPLNVFLFDSTR